jgi:hypothetical protein
MSDGQVVTVGDALPAEIKRVQAKRERWLGYQREAGRHAIGFEITIRLMQAEIDEAVTALATGDVVRMIRALESLRGYNEDD